MDAQCKKCGDKVTLDGSQPFFCLKCGGDYAFAVTPDEIHLTMTEESRWMVYGKDVIMEKTGQPMREFFEDEEKAHYVAALISAHKKGRLGVYACNDGTLESFEMVAEYGCGKLLIAGKRQFDPSDALRSGCSNPLLGCVLSAVIMGALLLLLKWIVTALKS